MMVGVSSVGYIFVYFVMDTISMDVFDKVFGMLTMNYMKIEFN